MPTYAGYQAISTPDFSAPFREQMSGLMSKRAAEEAAKQKAEQEELKYQRAQNDKFDLEYNKAVQEIEAGGVVDSANKDFDSEIIGWSRGGVEKLHFFSKTATIPERRAAITNMKSDVLNLKTVVDNLGDIAEQQQAKIQEQGGTAWRQNLQMQKNKDLINLNNKDIVWGDDFRGYINTYDSEGNVTKSQSILNMVSAAKIQDQFVNLIDLDGAIEDKIKTAGDFTQAAGNYTISDVRQKDGYPEWFKATLNDITLQGKDNGRMVDLLMDGGLSESVTLDNGVDVDIFGHGIEDTKEMSQIYLDVLTDAEDTKGAELTAKEEKEIKSAIDKLTFIHTEKGGKTEYAIKADTREFIKEKIGEKIEFALGYKKTKSGDGGGDDDDAKLSSGALNIYPITKAAFDDKDFSGLSDNYYYVWSEDGIKVYNITSSSGVKVSPQLVIDATADRKGSVKADDGSDVIIAPVVVKTPKQLSKYAYGGGTSGGASAYDKWDESYKHHTGGEYKSTEHEMKKPSVYDAINRTSRFSLPGEYTPSRNTSNTGNKPKFN